MYKILKPFLTRKQKMSNVKIEKKVLVVCPTCKSKKELTITESKLNQDTPLTTISLPKGFVCQHHFQMFLDKNFKIRGYQKVDLELVTDKNDQQKFVENEFNATKITDEPLLKNLNISGNKVEHYSKELVCNNDKGESKTKIPSRKREMSLEEIYEEFREFIDDDNETFRAFIEKDAKRKKGNNDRDLIGFNANLNENLKIP